MKKQILAILIMLSLVFIATIEIKAASRDDIATASQIAANMLMSQPGIAAVGYYENATQIYVSVESENYRASVPFSIDGYPTNVSVDGRIYAVNPPFELTNPIFSRTQHWTNMVGGISFGGESTVAGTGTVGVFCNWDSVGLTNAHVIAMDNDGNLFPPGGEHYVYQPGLADSGPVTVGFLQDYINIQFNTYLHPNHADAAIAGIYSTYQRNPYHILDSDNVNTYTVDLQVSHPGFNAMVRKSGRTTGVTQNHIFLTHVFAKIWYTPYKWAFFMDIYSVRQPFSASGDSGSFVDRNGHFVGLVFAGSNRYSYVCKASYIKNGLGIS